MAIFPNRYLVIDCGSRHIKGLLVEEALGSRKILRAEMLPAVSMRETAEADSAEEADGLREDYEYNLVR
ncbi:MAG: hypothetical protein KDK33_17340, partial [Leptospiraceae bacterium]|nr:hypothetical protein [Leptospiraceae bacterium]